MTFEAGPVSTSPSIPSFGLHTGTNVDDAAALLPEAELAEAKMRHTARIKQLRAPKSEGGFGLPELAAQVVAERRALERVENELTRQQPLKEDRGDRSAMRSGNSRKPGLWPMRC